MGAKEYFLRRLGVTITIILAVIVINFFLFRIMPANPVDILLSPEMGEEKMPLEIREALEESLGLNKPLWAQFLDYVQDIATLDFGYSFRAPQPVLQLIARRLPNTLVLMLTGNLLSILLSVSLGVLAAWKHGTKTDVISIFLALTFTSMPMFWVGGIILLVFSVKLDMFPLFGTVTIGKVHPNTFSFLADYLHHLFLPTVTMALVGFGGLFLIMRNSMLDVFSEDYILTAKAIGLKDRVIIFKNALSNALLPLITIIAIRLGFMISGSLLTETVFSWPGLGLTIFQAIQARDYPVLQASFLIITILVVLSNFIAEIIYGFADPRVRSIVKAS
jgi:peptide/nickel transport system permease protein